jgi:chaperone required for assembly of F1-ATPase
MLPEERLTSPTVSCIRAEGLGLPTAAFAQGLKERGFQISNGSDLICYRAGGPASLLAAQSAAWDPLVAWAREGLGARFRLAAGVVHVAQDDRALAAVDAALASLDPLGLAAVHTVTTLTGSAVIALAVLKARLTIDEAWAAAHVDEDWQMGQWGSDETSLARRAARRRDMGAAGAILEAARSE